MSAKSRWRAALHVERRWHRVFGGTLLLTLIAKGGAYLPGYSFDDYGLVHYPANLSVVFAQGRFGSFALMRLLDALQAHPRYANVLFVTLCIVTMAALGTLVARHWRVRGDWLPVAVAALVANHPFTIEIFTFRTALAAFGVPMAALALLLVPRRWTAGMLVAGTLLWAAALSVYQVVLQFAGLVLLGGLAAHATRVLVAGCPSIRWMPRGLRQRWTGLLVCVVLGTVLYLIAAAVGARLAQVQGPQTVSLLSPEGVPQRLAEIGRVLFYRHVEGNPLFDPFVLRLQQLLAGAAILALLWRIATARGRRGRASMLALAILALLALSLLWGIGIAVVGESFWPAPRVMAHTGLFWAVVLAVAYRGAGRRFRSIPALLAGLLLVSYVGTNNRVLQEQWRLNLRDALKARSIVSRLEELPGFAQADQIAIDGNDWWYPLGYATSDMDMNISAFGPVQSKRWVLLESSGYSLRPADDTELAARVCAGKEPWPAQGSVSIEVRVAVVCLGS